MNVDQLNRLLTSGKPAVEIWLAISTQLKQTLDASEFPVWLHACLPRLCEVLFGGVGARSAYVRRALNRAETRAFLDFIAPESILMTAILKPNPDPNALYEIYFNLLPLPTQRVLQGVDISRMPKMYETRVHVRDPQAQTTSPQKMVSVGHVTPGFTPRVMLNMFEYYFVCFAYTVTLSTNSSPPEFPKSTVQKHARHLKQLFTHHDPTRAQPAASSTSSTSYLDPVYFEALQLYLDFFLPRDPKLSLIPSSSSSTRSVSVTAVRQDEGLRARSTAALAPSSKDGLGVSSAVVGRLQRAAETMEHLLPWTSSPNTSTTYTSPAGISTSGSSVFKKTESIYTIPLEVPPLKRIDICHAMSEFIVGACVEYWMSHNEYLDFQTPNGLGQLPSYTQPTMHMLKSVQLLVQHVINMDLRNVARTIATREHNVHDVCFTCKRNAYMALGSKLYGFLQLALKYWPDDDFFPLIVDIWLSFITPWRVKGPGSGVDQDWLLFIAENYIYYAGIFKTFLQRAERFDLSSSARAVIDVIAARKAAALAATSVVKTSSSATKPKASTRNHLPLLQKVLLTFTDTPNLLNALKDIETTLGSYTDVNTFSAAIVNPSPFTTPVGRRGPGGVSMQKQASLLAVSLRFPELGNAGPVVKNVMQTLEGTSDWKPVFSGSIDPEILKRRLVLLNRVGFELSRIKSYMEQNVNPAPITETPIDSRTPSLPSLIQSPSTPTSAARRTLPSSLRTVSTPASSSRLGVGSITAATNNPKLAEFPPRPPADSGWLAFTVWIVMYALVLSIKGWNLSKRLWQSVVSETEARSPKREREKRAQILSSVTSSLEATATLIRKLWDLPPSNGDVLPTTPGIELAVKQASFMSDDSLYDEEEEGITLMYGPVLLAPEVRADNPDLLTRRGRMQLRKGLRKCDPAALPVRPSPRAEMMARSYEIEFLVRWTMRLAQHCEAVWSELRDDNPFVPDVKFTFLRLFAAKPNLLFLTLCFIVWYLVRAVWGLV
ncbi:sphingomyelin phosphodiesterase [Synchytrium endobioticum]|nr:sphingomyelin phosphodiesterase [Synchytrium endobioticum]